MEAHEVRLAEAPNTPDALVTEAADPNAAEALTEFLYLLPVGVLRFNDRGAVDLMNPLAAQLLLQVAPHGSDLADAFAALRLFSPDLSEQVAGFTSPHGPLLRDVRFDTITAGRRMVLRLGVHRVRLGVHVAVIEDVTRLAEQEDLAAAQRRRLASIVEHVRDYAIFTLDADGLVDEWNPSLRRNGGWEAVDVAGQGLGIFMPAEDAGQVWAAAMVADAARLGSVETEGWRRRRDGSRFWGNTVLTALPDRASRVRGFAVVERDLSERKTREDDLQRLAATDPLTGTANRRAGMAALELALAGGGEVSVLLLDLDRFKAVNDEHGHPVGDAVLKACAAACRAAIQAQGTLIRWGGEEFLIVLPGTGPVAARAVAERVLAAVRAARIEIGDAFLHVTASVGVATSASDTPDQLIRCADDALYAAKQSGRDRLVQAPASLITSVSSSCR